MRRTGRTQQRHWLFLVSLCSNSVALLLRKRTLAPPNLAHSWKAYFKCEVLAHSCPASKPSEIALEPRS